MKLGLPKNKLVLGGGLAVLLVLGYIYYRKRQQNAGQASDSSLGQAAPLGVINATAGSPSTTAPATDSLGTDVLATLGQDVSDLASALAQYQADTASQLGEIAGRSGASGGGSGEQGPPGPAGPPGPTTTKTKVPGSGVLKKFHPTQPALGGLKQARQYVEHAGAISGGSRGGV